MAAFLAAARQLMDADLRAQMGANAQARFAAEFRIDRMVDRYSALYEDLGAADWKQIRWK
jgi:glycosyltransferase involved in cell wall biosynthesis